METRDNLLRAGLEAFAHENYDLAIEKFSEVISSNRNDGIAYFSRGMSYSKLERYDQAIEDLSQAILIENPSIEFYYIRAFCYAELKDYDSAIEDLSQIILLQPEGNNISNKLNDLFEVEFLQEIFKREEFYTKLKPYLTFSQRVACCGETPPYLKVFVDHISQEVMNDPVTIGSGNTYDRESLRQYFKHMQEEEEEKEERRQAKDPLNIEYTIVPQDLEAATTWKIKGLIIDGVEQLEKSTRALLEQQARADHEEKSAQFPAKKVQKRFFSETDPEDEVKIHTRDATDPAPTSAPPSKRFK